MRHYTSELEGIIENCQNSRWIYFLRYVCVPEILDSSIVYESSDDLENERTKICQLLLKLDSNNTEEYSSEIHRLTQAKAVRDAIHQVDSSKVYVDKIGIAKSLDRAFYDGFDRYRQWYGLEERIRYSIITIDFTKGRGETTTTDLIRLDAAVELFNVLFLEIRHRFISSNEYGLDSYLSLRIRHGTLAGQLRRVYEERRIITTLESSTDKYHSNLYWVNRFSNVEKFEEIDQKLADFSKTIDDLIDDVKRNWIQIRSISTPQGLFDFEYTQNDLASLYLKYGYLENVNEFIEQCFDELNKRAELVLKKVRSSIRETLCDKLMNALTNLEQDVIELLGDSDHSEFSTCIAQCRTETQLELDLIAGWFETVGDATMPDYEVQHAVKTCIEMLRRTSPDKTARPIVDQSSKWQLPGETFTFFVDMIYIPLENAVKYSAEGPEDVSIRIFKKEQRAAISIENTLPRETDLDQLQELSKELGKRVNTSIAGQKIRSEGNSGYYKLGKLIQINLKSLEIAIEIFVDTENYRFNVTLLFYAEEVHEC